MSFNEFDIIEQIFKSQETKHSGIIAGIGDDAALLKIPEGQLLAVSTDTLVKGVHFPEASTPYDIGYKSLAVNLSDMAAMAAEPLWVTMALTLPDNNMVWLREYSKGFFEIAKRYKVNLVGGDITHGPLSITIQIIGCVPEGMQLRRNTARIGDDIYVTGTLGMSALALSIMNGKVKWDTDIPDKAVSRLNRPEPRVDMAISLRGLANSAIDISDGLAGDLGHLILSSGTGAEIFLDKLPVYAELEQLETAQKWHHALNMGDDYELCFTVPEKYQENVMEIGERFKCNVSCVGKVTDGKSITWKAADGAAVNMESSGYMHF
jgi:thiamine-monophosphate kinase